MSRLGAAGKITRVPGCHWWQFSPRPARLRFGTLCVIDDSMASEAVSVALQVGDEPCASLLSCMMELNVPCHHPKAP